MSLRPPSPAQTRFGTAYLLIGLDKKVSGMRIQADGQTDVQLYDGISKKYTHVGQCEELRDWNRILPFRFLSPTIATDLLQKTKITDPDFKEKLPQYLAELQDYDEVEPRNCGENHYLNLYS
jgi:hypothetical protein